MADLPEESTTAHLAQDDVKSIAEAVAELLKPKIDAQLNQRLETERESILKQVDNKLAIHGKRLDVVEDAIASMETMFAEMTKNVGAFMNLAKTNQQSISATQTAMTNYQQQLGDLLERMRTSEERDRLIREQVVANQEALTARVVDVESRSGLMVNQQNTMKGDISEIKTDTNAVKSDVKALSSAVVKMNESLIEHTTRASTTRKFVAGLLGAVIALGGNQGLEFLSKFIQ